MPAGTDAAAFRNTHRVGQHVEIDADLKRAA
jgi:hypothetical protein